MRILITNDDGINAPGLAVLKDIADEIAGDGGEVWTVAPAFEQSGVSHATSHTHPTMVSEYGPRRWAAEGSPADCVLAALHHILPAPPDLILSGVNRGNNAAQNAQYSGTLGAAIEGALQGIPSIGLSQFLGPRTNGLENPFEAAAAHGTRVVRKLLSTDWDEGEYMLFYSVNFPPVPAAEVKGLRAGVQGWRQNGTFGVEHVTAPNGRQFLWIKGASQQNPATPGSDADLNLSDYVSVTPMRADFTAHDRMDALKALLE